MDRIQYHLTKAGPRLLDALVDAPQIDCVVAGPGMLVQELQLLTNKDALSGCDAGFYREIAGDLEATSFCGHESPASLDVRVEPHRLGAELLVDIGPPSMYQALIRIRTRSGRSFRRLFLESMAGDPDDTLIAVFYAVRARSHHEHHSSAVNVIRRRTRNHADRRLGGGHGH